MAITERNDIMSEWITHRPPTEEDAGPGGIVWTTYNGEVAPWSYDGVEKGTPWMPIVAPEPYVKPKRWRVNYSHTSENWYIWNDDKQVVQLYYLKDFYKHYEVAKEIAAIYERTLP